MPEYRLEMLTWPPDQAVQAMELLSGMMIDANGELSPAPPAGTEFSRARREKEEATWQWVKRELERLFRKR